MFARLLIVILVPAVAGFTSSRVPLLVPVTNNWSSRNQLPMAIDKTSSCRRILKMVSQEERNQLANKWVNAWNSRDLTILFKLPGFFADDVEYTSPFIAKLMGDPSSDTLYGKEALSAYFQNVLNKYPDIMFQPLNAIPGLSLVVIRYVVPKHMTYELLVMQVDPNGKVKCVATHSCVEKQTEEIIIDDNFASVKPDTATTRDSIIIEQPKSACFADKWLEDWNSRNLDAIMLRLSDDVEFVSPHVVKLLPEGFPDGTICGKRALRSYFLAALSKKSDLHFDLPQGYAGQSSIAVTYRSTPCDLMVCDIFELETMNAEKVSRIIHHSAWYKWFPRGRLGHPLRISSYGI